MFEPSGTTVNKLFINAGIVPKPEVFYSFSEQPHLICTPVTRVIPVGVEPVVKFFIKL